jgi:hypothetical protein
MGVEVWGLSCQHHKTNLSFRILKLAQVRMWRPEFGCSTTEEVCSSCSTGNMQQMAQESVSQILLMGKVDVQWHQHWKLGPMMGNSMFMGEKCFPHKISHPPHRIVWWWHNGSAACH